MLFTASARQYPMRKTAQRAALSFALRYFQKTGIKVSVSRKGCRGYVILRSVHRLYRIVRHLASIFRYFHCR